MKLTFITSPPTRRRLSMSGPRMRGSHVGPGTFGCGRLGMLFMAFRFLQRKTMGKKKKKHQGNHQRHHDNSERGNFHYVPIRCRTQGGIVLACSCERSRGVIRCHEIWFGFAKLSFLRLFWSRGVSR